MEATLSSSRLQVAEESDASDFAYEKGWTDGLPIVAPTAERVQAFLAHAGLAPNTPVARYEVRNREISAEKVAVNAVMAGCKAEYFPVVVAAMKALTDHDFHLNHIASTSSPWPFFVVSGPIVERIGINTGAAVLAPGCHANATIGRAISLTLANCMEARVGAVQQGVAGNPLRYAGGVIGEASDTGWNTLAQDWGAPAGISTVSAISNYITSPQEVYAHPPERFPDAESLARLIAEHAVEFHTTSIGGAHAVIISPSMQRRFLADGWTKAQLRQYLKDNMRFSWARLMGRPGGSGIWPKGVRHENGRMVPSEEDYQQYWYSGSAEKRIPLPEEDPRSSFHLHLREHLYSDFCIIVAGAQEGPMIAGIGRSYALASTGPVWHQVHSPLCR